MCGAVVWEMGAGEWMNESERDEVRRWDQKDVRKRQDGEGGGEG